MGDERARARGPREWVGAAPFPWPPVEELPGGAPVVACYCVASIQKDQTRAGKPYYRLQLSDRHGTIEARVWDPVAEIMAQVRQGGFVGVRGRLEVFNGARQVKVSEIAPVAVGVDDLELFLPRSPRDPQEMEAELQGLLASVCDAGLRALLARLLDPGSETGRVFRRAPAAKLNHHAYLAGLFEHTLSITRACALMAEHYGPEIDRDLLIAGALLHDLGKIREIGTDAGFPYTDEGKLLGHILLGLQMVADTARAVPELSEQRLLLLQHLIASHQGRYEWQSPREPRILEALVLHYCDDLDAKMNQAAALLRTVEGGWTAHDRGLGRELFRHGRTDGDELARGIEHEHEDEHDGNAFEHEHEHENVHEHDGKGPGPRRRVRFAGKVPRGAEGKGKGPGEAGRTGPAAAPAQPRRTTPAAGPPSPGRSAPASPPPSPLPPPPPPASRPEPPEALPPKRVAPPEDVLPPDPHSLDLFN